MERAGTSLDLIGLGCTGLDGAGLDETNLAGAVRAGEEWDGARLNYASLDWGDTNRTGLGWAGLTGRGSDVIHWTERGGTFFRKIGDSVGSPPVGVTVPPNQCHQNLAPRCP